MVAGFKREKKTYKFKEEDKKELINYNPIYDYDLLEIEISDKKELISYEQNIVKEGKKIGEIAYKIGESLEAAKGVFKKYSTEENDPKSFVNWYMSLGLNKDQAYLFCGRYNLTQDYPEHLKNILSLSDRAIKETINRKTPEELKEKVVSGEFTSGKAIVEQRTVLVKMEISSTARNSGTEILEAEIIETEEEIKTRLTDEAKFLEKDIRERRKNLKNQEKKLEEVYSKLKGIIL